MSIDITVLLLLVVAVVLLLLLLQSLVLLTRRRFWWIFEEAGLVCSWTAADTSHWRPSTGPRWSGGGTSPGWRLFARNYSARTPCRSAHTGTDRNRTSLFRLENNQQQNVFNFMAGPRRCRKTHVAGNVKNTHATVFLLHRNHQPMSYWTQIHVALQSLRIYTWNFYSTLNNLE